MTTEVYIQYKEQFRIMTLPCTAYDTHEMMNSVVNLPVTWISCNYQNKILHYIIPSQSKKKEYLISGTDSYILIYLVKPNNLIL